MNKLICIIAIILIKCTIVSGQKQVVYTFLNASSLNDSRFTSNYKRLFTGDSIYQEKGLFFGDTIEVYTFKKDKGRLLTMQNGHWELFFNKGKTVRTKWIFFKTNFFSIQWKNTNLKDVSNVIYKLDFIPIGLSGITGLSYYFTYNDGIIAIDGEEAFLIRSDKTYLIKFFNIKQYSSLPFVEE